jgi:hypothetical protein
MSIRGNVKHPDRGVREVVFARSVRGMKRGGIHPGVRSVLAARSETDSNRKTQVSVLAADGRNDNHVQEVKAQQANRGIRR